MIYLDEVCSEETCAYQAVEQADFDDDLCETHLDEAYAQDEADMQVKYLKENGFEPAY